MTEVDRDLNRDVMLMDAAVHGGRDAYFATAIPLLGGEDAALAYVEWISRPELQEYRATVAAESERRGFAVWVKPQAKP